MATTACTARTATTGCWAETATILLDGDFGYDVLAGGAGIDTLSGGTHGDLFDWDFTDETGVTVATADLITDFNIAQGDRIDLSGVDADIYTNGDQAFTFIGTAAFSGNPGEINYFHSGGETIIQLQTGTSADVEAVIRLPARSPRTPAGSRCKYCERSRLAGALGADDPVIRRDAPCPWEQR